MISSLAYGDTFDRAKAIGAKGFVDKPFHQEQLLKVFERALRQSGSRSRFFGLFCTGNFIKNARKSISSGRVGGS